MTEVERRGHGTVDQAWRRTIETQPMLNVAAVRKGLIHTD